MKRLLLSVALCAAPIGLAAPSVAAAQIFGGAVVYDPSNHAQNVLQAARALQQLEHQIQQLTHEIQMLEHMARHLESLPVNLAEAMIRDRIRRIEALMRQAEGIGHEVETVERDFEALYPESYGETAPSQAVLVADARERWRQSRAAYRHTLTVTAGVLENNERDAAALSDLVRESQGAVGQLQATQAGNQISAVTAQQLMQMEAMLAAHYRAEAMERARALAEEERGRARTQSFLEQ